MTRRVAPVAPVVMVAFVAGLLSVVASCKKTKPALEEKTKLVFWHIQTSDPTKGIIDAAVKRFEAKHPGVQVEVVPIKNDPYKTKLRVAVGAGQAPDIFHTWGGAPLAEYAEAGAVADLSGFMDDEWRARLLPSAMALCQKGEAVYAVPQDVGVVVLWFNETLLKSEGVPPPEDFSSWLESIKYLRQQDVIPVALGNKEGWPGAFLFDYSLERMLGREETSRLLNDPTQWEDDRVIEAYGKLQTLKDAGAFQEDFNAAGYDQSRMLFFTGRSAMTIMGSWLLAHCTKEMPDFLKDLSLTRFPQVEGGAGNGTVLGGVNSAFAVSSSCQEKSIAVELLRELTSEETLTAWAEAGRLPAAFLDEPPTGAPRQWLDLKKILDEADSLACYFDQSFPPRLAEKHKELIQRVLMGDQTPEGAAKAFAQEAKALQSETGMEE